jgi:hypothetical protein
MKMNSDILDMLKTDSSQLNKYSKIETVEAFNKNKIKFVKSIQKKKKNEKSISPEKEKSIKKIYYNPRLQKMAM